MCACVRACVYTHTHACAPTLKVKEIKMRNENLCACDEENKGSPFRRFGRETSLRREYLSCPEDRRDPATQPGRRSAPWKRSQHMQRSSAWTVASLPLGRLCVCTHPSTKGNSSNHESPRTIFLSDRSSGTTLPETCSSSGPELAQGVQYSPELTYSLPLPSPPTGLSC